MTRFAFDSPTLLWAEAIGRPGQRVFYLHAGQDREWVRVRIEKFQLQQLADAIDELLAEAGRRFNPPEEDAAPAAEGPPVPPASDLEAGQMSIGYDPSDDRISLTVSEPGAADDAPPVLECRPSRGQVRALSRRIAELVAAGRPLCPVCEQPMDPDGHRCLRRNGHEAGGLG
ncbi:MAG TPA: DUF3090 family protein [Dehalococcoidia bacterium]